MSALSSLEKSLGDVFKNAPKMPENGKKFFVKYLPWVNLVLGVLALLTVYALWDWAHTANNVLDYVNDFYRANGVDNVIDDRLGVGIWIGLVVLAVQGLIHLAAFPGSRDRKKAGWNLMFYGVLLNAVYGVVVVFTDYGSVGSLIGYVIGTVVGLYILFQIRDAYNGASKAKAPAAKK